MFYFFIFLRLYRKYKTTYTYFYCAYKINHCYCSGVVHMHLPALLCVALQAIMATLGIL